MPIFLFLSVETIVRSTTNKVLGKNDPEVWRQLKANKEARYARLAVLQEEKKDPVPLFRAVSVLLDGSRLGQNPLYGGRLEVRPCAVFDTGRK